MSEVARVTPLAVSPGRFEAAGVDVCEPGWPEKSHVARMPVKLELHAPEPEPDPDPDPEPDPDPSPFVHNPATHA